VTTTLAPPRVGHARRELHPALVALGHGALKQEAELRAICLAAGAEDVGFVELERPALDALDAERPHILAALPGTRSLVSLVVRMDERLDARRR
jgi:hypothetical protein